ncbi:M48 family metallopeptidase [Tsukamurella soli]
MAEPNPPRPDIPDAAGQPAAPGSAADRPPADHPPTYYPPADYPPGGYPAPPGIGGSGHPAAFAGPPRRHPGEIPLLVIVVLITAAIYIGALTSVMLGDLTGLGRYALVALTLPFVVWVGRGVTWASPRVNGIQMTPTQFPEGYAMVREAAARYGLREVPDGFVVLGNGQINAFASGHQFRRYVVVYSDMFEVGGAARNPDALRFIIGHEVGHIAAGHVSFWRQLGTVTMQYMPVLGKALSRSQEYTADNYGYYNRPAGAPGAIGLLGGGKYLCGEVDFDQVADRASADRGLFTWLVNLQASHPVLTWRAAALRNRTRAGALFFAPSVATRGIGGGAVVPAPAVPTFAEQEVLAPPPGGR